MLKIIKTTTPEEIMELLVGIKNEESISLHCSWCGNTITRTRKVLTDKIAKQRNEHAERKTLMQFCDISCASLYKENSKGQGRVEVECSWCKTKLKKKPSDIRGKNSFCSKSCAVSYNNTNKSHGTRRSKLEVWLENNLTPLYPELEIHFNRKDAINSELDMYFPSLKLAVELNGIFHYEPIYGAEKLKSIQNNDNRKFQACLENDIELCIIDVSHIKYFKEEKAREILSIIQKLVDSK